LRPVPLALIERTATGERVLGMSGTRQPWPQKGCIPPLATLAPPA
jgi:hypothetical protein